MVKATREIFLLAVFFFSGCFCSSFIGLAKNLDSISYGLIDVKSGSSTLFSSFPLVTFNAPQFAYSPSTQLYTFIAFDSVQFDSFLLSLNASDGAVVYNTSLNELPLPFGLAYDGAGVLYGQVWYTNGTMVLASFNARTLAIQTTPFDFVPGDWWTYVSSTFCNWNDAYYSLFSSPYDESLVGINVLNGKVVLNITLGLNTTLGVATNLQYNNVTNTFYVLGFNNATQSYDLATINQATGGLRYLDVFTNTTLSDVTGMGLDSVNNILSIVYVDGYTTMLVNVDLKTGAMLGSTKLSSNAISTMLALSNL